MGGVQWRAAHGVDPTHRGALQALILTIGIGCLFNSLLLDSGEGKFFCLLAGVYLSGWRATQTIQSNFVPGGLNHADARDRQFP